MDPSGSRKAGVLQNLTASEPYYITGKSLADLNVGGLFCIFRSLLIRHIFREYIASLSFFLYNF